MEPQILQKNDRTCSRIGTGSLYFSSNTVFQEEHLSFQQRMDEQLTTE